MICFQKRYFFITIALLLTEILIALFVRDNFIRPYIGDVLVVVLIYCFLKSFFKIKILPLALSVLVFAYVVETLQYFNVVEMLNLQHSKIARIIIGSSFAWLDILAYTLGISTVIVVEKGFQNKRFSKVLL